MGGFGFFFWIICTRIFTPDEVGIGTTLISSMSLISFISLLGFNSTFVRFLPNSKNRSSDINTGSILVTCTALFISIIYVLLIPYITPKLGLIHSNIWYSICFIIMVALSSLGSLTDSIFIAYRSAQYSLITNGLIMSGSRLILPLVFAGIGAYGVFTASGLAVSIGMMAGVMFLIHKFNFRPNLIIDTIFLKKVFHYSFTNYIGTLLSIIPTFILPIIIIHNLGPSAAGYYYLAFMIINLLYAVSASISSSLFAEGSYGEDMLKVLLKRSVTILVIILVPASIILAMFGPFILQIFGKSYSNGGSSVIVMLSLGSPFVAIYNLSGALLKIRQQMYSVLFTNLTYAVTICLLSILWIDKGLTWVAIAWNLGNFIAGTLAFLLIFIYKHHPTPKQD